MEPFDSFDEFEEITITPAKPKRRGGRPKKQEVVEPVEITEEIPEDVKAFLEGDTDKLPERTEEITEEEAKELEEK